MLAVWKVEGNVVTPLGPLDGAGGGSDFDVQGGAGAGRALPVLLYSTSRGTGGLRPIAGQYRVDPDVGIMVSSGYK